MKTDPVLILLHGAAGRMGSAIADLVALADGSADARIEGAIDLRRDGATAEALKARGFRVFGAVPARKPGTVVIDFSNGEAVGPLTKALSGSKLPLVSGTTGLGSAERELLETYAEESPVFYDANMSYGISVLKKLLRVAAPLLTALADVEIVEFHHSRKADFPSGTALALARAIRPDGSAVAGRGEFSRPDGRRIHIHSVRAGGVSGDHDVHFGMDHEVLSLSHRALSRDVFARGAIRAARFVVKKQRGLFTMNDLLEAEGSG